MPRKLRVLWCSEYSQLSTGFSVYGNEVLKRLHATGKYELAELASYVDALNPTIPEVPWKVYPALPNPNAPGEQAEFSSDNINQFGKWKLEQTCLDFRPDIIVDIRDLWMSTFIDEGVFRSFYKFYYMPTVDAIPQRDNWIQVMGNADKIFSYTKWGLEVIKQQGNGQINTVCETPPGADFSVFKPLDKIQTRAEFGIAPGVNIIGFLSRNQKRKLIPDLIQAFKKFQEKCSGTELARKTYLYLHTSFPDVGWNIPDLIKNSGVGEKILLTYLCKHCGYYAPQFYKNNICVCPKCNEHAFMLTSTMNGVTREALAKLLNLCDCYMQFSNSEGFGMGAVEAAACGVPVMATNYSAMADVVHNTGGYPIKVHALTKESETGCFRAQPCLDSTVDGWIEFFSLSKEERSAIGNRAASLTRNIYDYDVTTQKWMDEFDKEVPQDWEETWDNTSFDIFEPMSRLPAPNLENTLEFTLWATQNVLGRKLRDYQIIRLAKLLNYGNMSDGYDSTSLFNDGSQLSASSSKIPSFTREQFLQHLIKMRKHINHWEIKRSERIGTVNP